MSAAAIIVLALMLDAIAGEPRWLWSRLPHPTVVIGSLIASLDTRLNHGQNRKFRGILALTILVGLGWTAAALIARLPFHSAFEVLIAAVFLAHRSLADHVRDVARGLHNSIEDGRRAVARIVGRDTANLEEPAIVRAAIESAAENLSDGVIAPVFWFVIAGLPGLLIYKIVNTADSMIGYRNARYTDFGWASARLDDLVNWIPARLTALLIALAHFRPDIGRFIRRDAPLHRSPNAGWPEAAMAACLDVALAGPRNYDGENHDFPFVYDEGDHQPGADAIDRSVTALWRTWALAVAILAILSVV